MVQGTLYTISAPSGAGKTSLVKALVEVDYSLLVSVSHTTRAQRKGEVEGENYHFVATNTFEQMVKDQKFLEHATVFGNHYGTSKAWVSEQLHSGRDVILEIDWQGAQQIHAWLDTQKTLDGAGIFILPPSLAALRTRLTVRGQDDDSVIGKRMAQAVDEISHYAEADYIVINDDFSAALADLQAIIKSRRLLQKRQAAQHKVLLNELLN